MPPRSLSTVIEKSPAKHDRLRLPRAARVRAPADFRRGLQQGRRLAHPLLNLHVLLDAPADADAATSTARIGLAVSRKVDPDAVGRNRIKRVLRDGFRKQRASLRPGLYLFTARPPAAGTDNAALRDAQMQLLQRACALPPSCSIGTMPASTSSPPISAGARRQTRSPAR